MPRVSDVKLYCSDSRPNNAFQPTPLRGPKIGGILKRGFVLTLVPIYDGGAAEC
jgi:hypothetical protein